MPHVLVNFMAAGGLGYLDGHHLSDLRGFCDRQHLQATDLLGVLCADHCRWMQRDCLPRPSADIFRTAFASVHACQAGIAGAGRYAACYALVYKQLPRVLVGVVCSHLLFLAACFERDQVLKSKLAITCPLHIVCCGPTSAVPTSCCQQAQLLCRHATRVLWLPVCIGLSQARLMHMVPQGLYHP